MRNDKKNLIQHIFIKTFKDFIIKFILVFKVIDMKIISMDYIRFQWGVAIINIWISFIKIFFKRDYINVED